MTADQRVTRFWNGVNAVSWPVVAFYWWKQHFGWMVVLPILLALSAIIQAFTSHEKKR